jgi:hypothetical protein
MTALEAAETSYEIALREFLAGWHAAGLHRIDSPGTMRQALGMLDRVPAHVRELGLESRACETSSEPRARCSGRRSASRTRAPYSAASGARSSHYSGLASWNVRHDTGDACVSSARASIGC